MLKVYDCIATAHDLKLVALAALICALASITAINLLRHARKSTDHMRNLWLAISAISTGFGIWATHFVAMLAFTPGIPSGYNVALTILSLVAAIVLTGAGLTVSLARNWRHGPWVGGAIIAGGIAAMHYTGMAAFEIAGVILWDSTLVVASILLGAAIGAAALPVGLHGSKGKWKIGGAVLLTLAICSHHFTAMGAVSIIPNPTIEIPPSALPAGWLAVGVAVASFAIIGLALAGVVLDIRDRRRSELEVDRMRDLADASIEGLLVCDGDQIVSVNTSFASLAGLSGSDLVGASLTTCFPDKAALDKLLSGSNQTLETRLRHPDGSLTPVELILRPIVFAGRPHHVVAVRDLQARKAAEQHIHYLAHHDPLTTLPNRGLFNTRIDQELAELTEGESLAVLCLDLDRFKEVNDLFGHAAGDTVLQTVASRCHRGARPATADGTPRRRRVRHSDAPRYKPGRAQAGWPRQFSKHCVPKATRRRPTASRRASASQSIRTMRRTARRCSATPTQLFIGPRAKAATPGAFSRPAWVPKFASAGCSNMICVLPLRATNCGWHINPSKISRARPPPVSKPCCAGNTRPAARFRRPSSFRLPKRPVQSSRSANGS